MTLANMFCLLLFPWSAFTGGGPCCCDMVMFSTWQRTASDQKRNSVMQMTSEDTGLGALTPNLAGYLGKVQERTSSLENCPWCSSKGWVHALRSYRVNLQESITLCTNPQCLYPLVSRPLEDVLAELVPVKTQIGVKKNGQVLPSKDIAVPPPKRLRSNGDEQALEGADSFVTEEEPPAIEVDGMELNVLRDPCEKALRGRPPSEGPISSEAACQGEGAKDKSDDVLVPTWSPSKPTAGETALASASPLSSEGVCGAIGAASAVFAPRHASVVKDGTPGDVLFRQANGPLRDGLRPCSLNSNQGGEPFEDPVDSVLALAPANEPMAQKPWLLDSDGTSMLTGATTNEIKPEALSPTLEQADPNVPPRLTEAGPPKEPEKLVSPPPRLFWRNSDNLCWLDTLLVALVNCKSLRDHGPSDRPQKSPIWELITKYDEVCAAVQAHQHTGKDGVVRVPNGVLQNAYSDLHSIRMSVFWLLQPKLQCRLGRRETPVFALPVLVAGDPWAESLFEQTFEWEFECSSCKGVSNTRVTKPLPTFTSLVPDWHPEKAAHLAPCNMCHKKNQRRTMVLDSIPPVFALHFVNGLPNNDPQTYSFRRHGRCYAVSTVIQYDQTIKHFVTWTRTSDGMWQEFDDLKHPGCSSHAKLPVPAQEMHIVFWEADKDPARQACCPPTPVGESPPSNYKPDQTTPPALSPDQSLLQSYDDGDIDCALALSEDGSGAKEASADLDASIGSTTLLDTFEGLSHSDIVTLTLVEVRVDSEGNALADVDPTPETASPDTSNVIADSTPKDAPSEVLSDPDSAEHMSSDPTFVPGSSKRKRQVRVKAKSSSDDNKGRKPKAKTAPSRGAPSKRSKKEVLAPVVTTAVAVETPPGPTAQPAAAAATGSSRNTSPPPPSPSEKTPEPRLEPVQQARWSFMLSRHPQSQAKDTPDRFFARETPAAPAATTTALEKTPIKSAPIPARRASAVKPQLRKESGELPLKHAGMYDAFGVNRNSTSSSSPQPAPQCLSHKPPHAPLPAAPRTPTATKMVSNAFLSPGATALPNTALSGKRDRLPGVAGGPGATDALRCKLLKKLKAKKKKLEALNQLLSRQGGAGAEACSPQAVTSSTTVSACEDLFTDWLSPTSTVSNLSPDSSGLLEMRANGREAGDRLGPTGGGASQMNYPPLYSMTAGDQDHDHLLEEFMSAVPAQQQTQMETQDLGELDAGGKKMCAVSTAFESFDMDDLYLF